MDDVRKAVAVHGRIDPRLRAGSKIVLSFTQSKVIHRLEIPCSTQRMVAEDRLLTDQVLNDFKARDQYYKRWCEFADHNLLCQMIGNGCLPHDWYSGICLSPPPSHSNAYAAASKRGHHIWRDHSTGEPPSNGEIELWYAAHQIWNGAFRPFLGRDFDWAWRNTVVQIEPQFIVPNRKRKQFPFAIDQLWILKTGPMAIRLVALESDGPHHLTKKEKERDARRDAELGELGYDVVRVAGWWALVDPYRVICEFLSVAGIAPEAARNCHCRDLMTISDYKCCLCGMPMIRWDTNWIFGLVGEDGEDGELEGYAHRSCIE